MARPSRADRAVRALARLGGRAYAREIGQMINASPSAVGANLRRDPRVVRVGRPPLRAWALKTTTQGESKKNA